MYRRQKYKRGWDWEKLELYLHIALTLLMLFQKLIFNNITYVLLTIHVTNVLSRVQILTNAFSHFSPRACA